ncbi:MAG TPA: hypothetical protein VGK73_27235 [Polyangiaceae bacterium]
MITEDDELEFTPPSLPPSPPPARTRTRGRGSFLKLVTAAGVLMALAGTAFGMRSEGSVARAQPGAGGVVTSAPSTPAQSPAEAEPRPQTASDPSAEAGELKNSKDPKNAKAPKVTPKRTKAKTPTKAKTTTPGKAKTTARRRS